MRVLNSVYLTADKSKAVRQGNPKAAVLLCGRNADVPDDVAKHFGLTEDGAPGDEDDPKGETKTDGPIFPARGEMVNANTPDGVNTAPGSVPAVPIPAANAPGVDHTPGIVSAGKVNAIAQVAGITPAAPAPAAPAPITTPEVSGASAPAAPKTGAAKTAAKAGRKGRGR